MASSPRKSFVRQTRSMTKAAQEAANLQIGAAANDAVQPAEPIFEPSIVEPERGEEYDCAGCTRSNNAELYMVRCEKCEMYYHFSCANVTLATVNNPPFVCRTCLPPKPRSVRSIGSHVSSTRSARIAMQLQQMEEQHRIQEEMTKERLAQLERQQLYNSKKFELLRQQEEEDERRSVRSSESRQSTNRVEQWIKSQTGAGNPSLGINEKVTESDDHVQPLNEGQAEELHVKFTSTPLTSPNASPNASPNVSALLPERLDNQNEKEPKVPNAPCQTPNENPSAELPDPPATMESLFNLLQISLQKPQNTGAIPKIFKVPTSAFDEWRNSLKRKDLEPIPEEKNDETKKRDQDLLVLLQQLEDQRAQEQQLQRKREEELKRQLQQQEREQARQKQELQREIQRLEAKQKEEQQRLLQQQERERLKREQEREQLAKQQKELDHLRKAEQERIKQLQSAKQSEDWYAKELQKLLESREKNQSSPIVDPSTTENNIHSHPRSEHSLHSEGQKSAFAADDLTRPSSQLSRGSITEDSPVGGRTRSLSSLAPQSIAHSIKSAPSFVPPRSSLPEPFLGTTKQQIAARQVVSKELPVFTGNPADCWVALFTCLTIRAVHLELVASLSTDSCKKAIRRFIARRGAPQEIYSDKGTNFQGASAELKQELAKVDHNELSSTFTDTHTQWRFNPPAAPHMGGCWERMVRSVKAALGAIPVERKLDEESLVTLLAEAEHMVNSRPLTFVPLESADSESLTPNHFLMLSSNGVQQAIKDPVAEGAAIKSSWNLIQYTLDEFWSRWVKEYLPTIARRTKWFTEVRPFKEGDLVLVVDEGHRNGWLRGRVARTYPGTDGRVRRVDVLCLLLC